MRMKQNPEILSVYVTTGGMREAGRLAEGMVSRRLAACANILGSIQSVYWWDGRVRKGKEVAILFKTTRKRVDELVAALKAAHSYECPCIEVYSVAGGYPEFLDWVRQETGSESMRRRKA